jgi:hypothetical protein
MKKLFVFLFFFVTGSVFSDMTIVQKVETSGVMGQPATKGNMTIYIKGSKMKVDNMGQSMSQIVDIDSGMMFIINPAQKTVMTATVDQMKQYAGMLGQAGQGGASAQKTGNSKEVNGYPCEEYKITTSGMVSSETIACVSDKIESAEFEKFRKFSEDLTKFGALPADIKGYPVVSDTKMSIMGQNVTSHSEIVSVSYDAVPDSVFAIPSDYKTTEMPQMPKMG